MTSKLATAIGSIMTQKEFLPKLEEIYDVIDSNLAEIKVFQQMIEKDEASYRSEMWQSVFKLNYDLMLLIKPNLNDFSTFLSVKTVQEENMADLEKYEDIFERFKNIQTIIFKMSERIYEISGERLELSGKSFTRLETYTDYLKFSSLINKVDLPNKETMNCYFENVNDELRVEFMKNHHQREVALFRWFVNDTIIEIDVVLDICKKIYILWNKFVKKDYQASTMY